jgi:glucose/arabinose dehydrogenase
VSHQPLASLPDDALGSAVAQAFRFPPTPDLAPVVRARLEHEGARVGPGGLRDQAGSRRPARWLDALVRPGAAPIRTAPVFRRVVVLALLALVIVAAVAAALTGLVPGIRIRFVEEVPGRVEGTPLLPPSAGTDAAAIGARLGLGEVATLPELQAAVARPVFLPANAALGPPDALYLDRDVAGGMVSGVWFAGPDRPPASLAGVAVLMSQFDGYLDQGLLDKAVDDRVRVEAVRVGSDAGWWLSGASHILVGRGGPDGVVEVPTRLAGDTLVWTHGGITFRLETEAGLERALAIAGSMQPVLEPDAVSLTVEPFADGLSSPVFVTGTRGGRGWLYVVEQEGVVRAISPSGQVAAEPILDLRDRVLAGGEQGLLGLALHPGYAQNGRLFVDYTRAEDGATVVSEFHAAGGVVDPASERVLLVIPQPYPNHNGGMIAFDREGMLLIGVGDGGSGGDPEGNGQDRGSLLGKLLRIDVDAAASDAAPYAIPADNPFRDTAGTRPEIWALGLRNPWRFSVDRITGVVFVGDVGQGAQEEIDVLPAGEGGRNLGWNVTEGDACYAVEPCDRAGLTAPVATIGHDEGACSVIGGYVYRGAAIPELMGGYLYADHCLGEIRMLAAADAVATVAGGGAGGRVPARVVASGAGRVSSFGEDDAGELYVVDLNGRVLRVVASSVRGGRPAVLAGP